MRGRFHVVRSPMHGSHEGMPKPLDPHPLHKVSPSYRSAR